MELIQGLTGGFGKLLTFTLPFLFVLMIVVFVHELGHFLVARWCGVKVKAFSIGFGKEIFGFYDRYGTRWRFAWVPLGGYVKFLDDENSASVPSRDALARMSPAEREGAFQSKPLAARAAIVAAGPIANFLLAIAIFTVSYTVMGMHVTAPRVDELLPDGVAATSGFQVGDVIVKIDGQPVDTFNDMQRVVSGSADKELTFEVNRGGAPVTLKATPARRELVDRFGNKMRVGQIGIRRNATQHEWEFRRYGPIDAFVLGVKETAFIITRTLQFLQELVLGREFDRSAARADRHRRDLGAGGDSGHHAAAEPGGPDFREHRPHQSVPDSAARWRSSFVLCHRGG